MKKHVIQPLHTTKELIDIKNQSKDDTFKLKLRALINLKKGKAVKEVSELLLVSRQSLSDWQRRYNTEGLKGLETNKGGRPHGNPKWDTNIFKELTTHIHETNGYWSVPLMQEWIEKKYTITIPLQTIWYHLCLLEFSYKSARPHPYKGDLERQTSFKKGALLSR